MFETLVQQDKRPSIRSHVDKICVRCMVDIGMCDWVEGHGDHQKGIIVPSVLTDHQPSALSSIICPHLFNRLLSSSQTILFFFSKSCSFLLDLNFLFYSFPTSGWSLFCCFSYSFPIFSWHTLPSPSSLPNSVQSWNNPSISETNQDFLCCLSMICFLLGKSS